MPNPREPRSMETKVDVQLTETIRQLHEVSIRIDERIKHLIEKQTVMSDKLERFGTIASENSSRITFLEKSGIDLVRDELEENDKKIAIIEKQLNNGIRSDVNDIKEKVRTLELSNEHNSSFRDKGEARMRWGVDAVWKMIQIIMASVLAYMLSKK